MYSYQRRRDAATPIVEDGSFLGPRQCDIRYSGDIGEITRLSKPMEQNKARLRLYMQGSDTGPQQSSEMPRRSRKRLVMAIGIGGFAAIIGVAALMVIALACANGAEPDEAPTPASPTAGGTTPTDSSPPPVTEISQALEAAEGSEVTVSGHLIADSDGNTRLCSVLAESLPPQCGGDRINLLGFDASSVPNSKTPQRPSEIQTAKWTDSYITVTGVKRIGGLAEVRLSTETTESDSSPTPEKPGEVVWGGDKISCTQEVVAARYRHLQVLSDVRTKYEHSLVEIPGVVGAGMGFVRKDGQNTNVIGIIVIVETNPGDALLMIPSRIENCIVTVETIVTNAVAEPAGAQSEEFLMEGHSMEPNFRGGQVVQFKKVAPSDLRRGDVIVFNAPSGPERRFMKRVVALPGEQIEIKNGIVFVDGQEILEPYGLRRGTNSLKTVVLKGGEYFVLGDNRPQSNDSRNWGPLPVESILGRAVVAGQ